jgi:hypothetical protein
MNILVLDPGVLAGTAPDATTAVIRLRNPGGSARPDGLDVSRAGWGAVLELAFWDAGLRPRPAGERLLVALLGRWRGPCLAIGRRLFGRGAPWRPFLAADTQALLAFAHAARHRDIQRILVVSDNGHARAWTIARALSGWLGVEPPRAEGWQRESQPLARTLARAGLGRTAMAARLALPASPALPG